MGIKSSGGSTVLTAKTTDPSESRQHLHSEGRNEFWHSLFLKIRYGSASDVLGARRITWDSERKYSFKLSASWKISKF
ncbi:Hemin import ATP-binding protein HmuV [Trichinella spiralis]|uniref:Hemin import ATP-binding protein HmuV n=1 Tax=Trichinella spiralis TaxID=6334 RepID=A0ABR3KDC1_TRISP